MAIINSRPLTYKCLNNRKSLEPLTANHLLTMQNKTFLPLPGNFVKEEVYARRRWRKEYLISFNSRQKRRHRNRSRRSSTEWVAPRQDHLETSTDQRHFVRSMKIITHTRINAHIGKFCIRAFRGLYKIRSANSLPCNRKRYRSMPLYICTLITEADSFLVYLNINLIV